MATDRVLRVWAAVVDCARRRGEHVSSRHVCLAVVDALSLSGAGLALAGRPGALELVYATGADGPTELAVNLGEGPGVDAAGSGTLVVAVDLAAQGGAGRWPAFAPEATARGVRALYSVPLMLGALSVGVLDLHRDEPREPGTEELLDAVVYADTALLLAIDELSGVPVRGAGEAALWHAEVHQAAGMVAVQLGIPVLDALVRLRVHAYRRGQPLAEVARAVVDRRLRLPGNGSQGRLS
ncbi:ANTAR domain-containing protein [Amycolatopsis sacchari]